MRMLKMETELDQKFVRPHAVEAKGSKEKWVNNKLEAQSK